MSSRRGGAASPGTFVFALAVVGAVVFPWLHGRERQTLPEVAASAINVVDPRSADSRASFDPSSINPSNASVVDNRAEQHVTAGPPQSSPPFVPRNAALDAEAEGSGARASADLPSGIDPNQLDEPDVGLPLENVYDSARLAESFLANVPVKTAEGVAAWGAEKRSNYLSSVVSLGGDSSPGGAGTANGAASGSSNIQQPTTGASGQGSAPGATSPSPGTNPYLDLRNQLQQQANAAVEAGLDPAAATLNPEGRSVYLASVVSLGK